MRNIFIICILVLMSFMCNAYPVNSSLSARNSSYATNNQLPYDAEVEYLESNGTENYIFTGIVPNMSNAFRFKIRLPQTGTWNGCYLAWNGDNASPQCMIMKWNNSMTVVGVRHFTKPNTGNTQFKNIGSDGIIEGILSRYSGTLNGVTSTLYAEGNVLSDLRLFGFSGDGARIYYFTIDNQCDLIPVRIEDEGFFYDKISKKLFGNQGSGKFILGPDKVEE